MKIYIVEANAGEYDSFHWWIHSIHTDPIKAEDAKNKINEVYAKLKFIPNPFPDVLDEYDMLIEGKLSEEDEKKYYDWWWQNHEANEWGGAKVVEYETDKVFKYNFNDITDEG